MFVDAEQDLLGIFQVELDWMVVDYGKSFDLNAFVSLGLHSIILIHQSGDKLWIWYTYLGYSRFSCLHHMIGNPYGCYIAVVDEVDGCFPQSYQEF